MQVCISGLTFRQAYSTFRMITCLPSNSNAICGIPLSCNRRFCNKAFQAYLELLDFPSQKKLNYTFSRSTCEFVSPDGTRSINSIVMDGTVVGLLGKLPDYQRPVFSLPRFQNKQIHGLLLRSKPVREVLDDMWILSSKSRGKVFFVPISLATEKENVIVFLIQGKQRIRKHDKSEMRLSVCIQFFRECFRRLVSPISILLNKTNEDSVVPSKSRKVVESSRLALQNNPLHYFTLPVSDFGRCFTSNSIISGALRSKDSETVSEQMIATISNIIYDPPVDYGTCKTCLRNLGRSIQNILPSGSALCYAAAQVASFPEFVSVTPMLQAAVNFLSAAVHERKEYMLLYKMHVPIETEQYRILFENGYTDPKLIVRDWIA